MAYQSLILGILFSVGIFAIKSGVGVSYVLSNQRKKRAKLAFWVVFATTYFLVFAVAWLILRKIDLVRHFSVVQNFIKSGMLVHVMLAFLMMAWGMVLLKQREEAPSKTKGWFMLVVPCPVCMTVIFFTTGFLMTLFPDIPKTVTGLLYLGFLLINMATVALLLVIQRHRQTSPESMLGGAMILIAAYFFLSVTVMPHFADANRIYRMAHYQGGSSDKDIIQIVLFVVITATAFLGGYGLRLKQIRSAK